MSAIEVDRQTNKAAQRFSSSFRRGRIMIHCRFNSAPKRSTIFDLNQYCLVRGKDRLNQHRHDGKGNEQQHCQPGGQEKPEKGSMAHGDAPLKAGL
jgi:hypothetical protein